MSGMSMMPSGEDTPPSDMPVSSSNSDDETSSLSSDDNRSKDDIESQMETVKAWSDIIENSSIASNSMADTSVDPLSMMDGDDEMNDYDKTSKSQNGSQSNSQMYGMGGQSAESGASMSQGAELAMV
jgi:hypothetical protein